MRVLFVILVCVFGFGLGTLPAQTNISGVVNTYAAVTGFPVVTSCATGFAPQVSVASAAGFAVGDRVMLVQMKGATISTANDATYGSITAYNNAGLFEFHTIASIAGTTFTLSNPLQYTYDVANGRVQLIRVPQYPTGATVTATLTPAAWNGTTGGILVIEVTGTLTLNADISANGMGFRGGAPNANNNFYCSFNGLFADNASIEGGQKGEGITENLTAQRLARGRWANGGGGGNNTNAGGAGGGGHSPGGNGGGEWSGCNNNLGGFAGVATPIDGTRLLMGGGGGGGHQNNAVATAGGNGGGIVLVYCGNLVGNARSITANGSNAANSNIDGAGGGGAGGIVAISATTITGNLTLQANGGNAGVGAACHGCGGGGGGGRVLYSGAALPGTVTVTTTAGAAGIVGGCAVQSGAAGTPGSTLLATTFTAPTCPLPVEWARFEANRMPTGHVDLQWESTRESNLSHYVVERSTTGGDFQPLAARNPTQGSVYLYTDVEASTLSAPVLYYRIRSVDLDGSASYTETRAVALDANGFTIRLLNNPVGTSHRPVVAVQLPSIAPVAMILRDVQGRVLWQASPTLPLGITEQVFGPESLAPGVYHLQVSLGNHTETRTVLVQ